jgi:hypothetical protein
VIAKSFKSSTRVIKTEDVNVIYNLVFKNALYSFECYKEGSNGSDIENYCLLEDVTDDEGEAEAFLHLMAKGKVFPVHIQDMVVDYFEE